MILDRYEVHYHVCCEEEIFDSQISSSSFNHWFHFDCTQAMWIDELIIYNLEYFIITFECIEVTSIVTHVPRAPRVKHSLSWLLRTGVRQKHLRNWNYCDCIMIIPIIIILIVIYIHWTIFDQVDFFDTPETFPLPLHLVSFLLSLLLETILHDMALLPKILAIVFMTVPCDNHCRCIQFVKTDFWENNVWYSII